MAKASQLDPIIGREGEVDKLLQILARRHRVNPVLTGPSGVGKTAVMHALAQVTEREREGKKENREKEKGKRKKKREKRKEKERRRKERRDLQMKLL